MFAHYPIYAQTQLSVDAGINANYCIDDEYITFGGNPTASGGTEPYN
ncbi:MAG: hypothetical protein PF517_08440 [Salinivirgaceae bacterium]|jgi:hypothetical protein|nr:hypothetical protein [Salinivirgaceae bacterium]